MDGSHGVPLPTSPSSLIEAVPNDTVEKIRLYLGVLRGLDYSLSEDAQKVPLYQGTVKIPITIELYVLSDGAGGFCCHASC